MVKITGHGITMEVHEADLDLYKKAGYSVVIVEPPAPEKVEPPASEKIVPAETSKKPKK